MSTEDMHRVTVAKALVNDALRFLIDGRPQQAAWNYRVASVIAPTELGRRELRLMAEEVLFGLLDPSRLTRH